MALSESARQWIREQVAAAPPLSEETTERLRAIIWGSSAAVGQHHHAEMSGDENASADVRTEG